MTDKVIKLKTDDELVLEQSNDSILEKALDYAIVEQKDENILAYSVNGLYTNEKNEKYNPPQLNIKDSNGNEVTFNLTKEYTNSLMKTLSEVNRAYHGYKYVSDKDLKKVSFKERIKNIFGYMKKHPIKSVIGLLFILLVIFVLAIGTKI